MGYVKVPIPEEVYHLTKRENAENILREGKVRRYGDDCCWFCRSVPELLRYMQYTVLCEGKPYYKTGGGLGFYPPFVPEDYVLLKLKPRYREGNWYQWNQELPPGSTPELQAQAKEFSSLKVGFRGDLRFQEAEVIEASQVMEQLPEKSGLNFEQHL